jgi:hypothetical protein
MIPDAGLDAEGRMTVDLGARTFVAEIDPGFRLRLRDTNGNLRDALPKPAEGESPLFTEARRMFTSGKKQIRSIGRSAISGTLRTPAGDTTNIGGKESGRNPSRAVTVDAADSHQSIDKPGAQPHSSRFNAGRM